MPWKKARTSDVPAVRGIYAFTLQFENPLLPKHGYVLYVGIVGDKNERTLRVRFRDYFSEFKKDSGRPKVRHMLKKWRGQLTFQCAVVPDRRFSLKKLERQLCDSIVPYINKQDLSAKLREGKEAAGL